MIAARYTVPTPNPVINIILRRIFYSRHDVSSLDPDMTRVSSTNTGKSTFDTTHKDVIKGEFDAENDVSPRS